MTQNNRWMIALVALFGVIAVGVGVYWGTSGPLSPRPSAADEKPALEVLPREYDFGAVSVAGGEVYTRFTLKNVGPTELVLRDMDTSCGCTEAALVVDGREGPRFNMRMHGRNPTNWSARLAPGQEAELVVYYNPQVHPDLRGAVTREVYLFGEDLRAPLATVRIDAYQTD